MSNIQAFTVDARVMRTFDKYDIYGPPMHGVITADPQPCRLTGKMKVVVKWENKYTLTNPQEVFVDQLILETEGNALWSKLESEFKAVENHIKDKLQVAAQAIAEASEIADSAKMDLSSMWEATQPLMRAMDKVGWQTSSLNC